MTTQESVGKRLRWAREQAGLSQGQVARLLEMHRPTISQIESGKRRVAAEEVATFAATYQVEEVWIIKGDDALPNGEDPRLGLLARELKKLKTEDLDSIARIIRVLKKSNVES